MDRKFRCESGGKMKVKDLIEELKLYNPEQEIYGVLAEDENSEQYLLETSEGTFVEWKDGIPRICFFCHYC